MPPLFRLDELSNPSNERPGSGILKDNFFDSHLAKVESLKQLSGRLPKEGEIYFLWTVNSFNAFTFIPFMVKEHGVINELILSTYSMSSRILNSLTHYIEKGKVEKVHILISDSIKFRIPRVQAQLIHLCSQYPQRFSVSYGWNHSKITLIGTLEGGYVMEGSGNFSENAQYEQYILLKNQKVYDFRKAMIYDVHPGTGK